MNKENAIDLMKFVMSLLIVAIHVPILTGSFSSYDSLISNGIARAGVPFFFISGSYFLFKKSNGDFSNPYIKKYFFKLIRLYCIWSVIYFLPILTIALVKDPSNIIAKIPFYIKDVVFNGIAYHLWYINSTIVCTFTFLLILRNEKTKIILLPLSLLLYICGLLCSAYNVPIANAILRIPWLDSMFAFITKYSYSYTFSFPFFWMIFIYLGYRFSDCVINISLTKSIVYALSSVILLYSELYIIDSNNLCAGHSLMIFIVPVSCCLFILARKMNLRYWGEDAIYPFIRHLSTLIYLLHPLIWLILCILYRHLNVDNSMPFLSYMAVLSISILISVIIIKASNSSNKYIRKLSLLYR